MFLHSMPMEEVKSSISSVKFKKMGNDSIQYNVRTVRGFIQLAPYKLYETNLNVCLLLLARGARTCACAWNFNFFKSGPSWVLIPSKRRRATAESAAGVCELQRARVGLAEFKLLQALVPVSRCRNTVTPASPGTVPVTTSASDLGCKHRDMPVVQQTPSPTSESSQAGCLCSGSSYRIAMIHVRNQMRVPEQHRRAPNRATSRSRHWPCADCACTCLRYAVACTCLRYSVDTFHLCLL